MARPLRTRAFGFVIGSILVAMISPALHAQAIGPVESISSEGALFRLTPLSAYQDGCIDSPCECAVRRADKLVGTMRVHKPEILGTVIRYPITDICWWAVFADGTEVMITGRGEFNAISGFAGWIRELALDLSIDGSAPVRVSGLFNTETGRLNLRKFPIAGDIDRCLGVRILVDAVPVRLPVTCFALRKDSLFVEGCISGPCLCPTVGAPLSGRFVLIELGQWDGLRHFVVARVRLRVGDSAVAPARTFAGFGRYFRKETAGGAWQRMRLWLRDSAGEPAVFDSGLVEDTTPLPVLDVVLSKNGFGSCFDTELHIFARPCRICPDLTSDGVVDFDDVLTVLNHWDESYVDGAGPGDADQDGIVSFDDVMAVLAGWLDRCRR